ncbi:FecR domain-containing protein [Sphingobacterium sp. UT-1RO-CII-1]|uniref:FecR family protein n=1 Tax=Sphingobacterium sp. UT-1RO-CII-1 TaxID=2995225 RepID=UPI00227C2D5B|nr:FecR family protein [Sphingobacterium sp. UT-1RO-CII-1]MCY4780762.1 FecR domain-containing protein [Sphingobacterium sp. UT-1RO-CII-1]
MNNNEPFKTAELLIRFLRNELSQEEDLLFKKWLNEDPRNRDLLNRFKDKRYYYEDLLQMNKIDLDEAWDRNQRKLKLETYRSIKRRMLYVAASVIFVLAGTLSVLKMKARYDKEVVEETVAVMHDVEAASAGANLLLADGTSYSLQSDLLSVRNKNLYTDEDQKDQLIFQEKINSDKLVYNTLEVPKAKYFKMQLPDGTWVWINSLSSLQFPIEFVGDERKVFLKGEAYFEVAHDENKPFIVESGDTKIQVLGTSFNINAYSESIHTTLAEGSVSIDNGKTALVLRPGEMARSAEGEIKREKVDLDYVLAWVNNEFVFKNDNILTIATQLASWYGVQVKFNGEINYNKTYTGAISRQVNLSEAVRMLQFASDLVFEIKDNNLIIKKGGQ